MPRKCQTMFEDASKSNFTMGKLGIGQGATWSLDF